MSDKILWSKKAKLLEKAWEEEKIRNLEGFLGRQACEADLWLMKNGWKHELSGGGCLWAIKSVGVGGLWMTLTNEDGGSTPVRMDEPVQVGLYDVRGSELCDLEWDSLTEMEREEDKLRWVTRANG